MTTGASQQTDPTPPRRSRARTFVPLAIAAWLVLEIWLLIVVADAASGFAVFLLLVAGVVIGGAVVKRAGRRAWQNLAASMQPGAPAPHDSAPRGNSFLMLGGVLLMVPGLVSDALGLLCLFPPTRALLRLGAERVLARQIARMPGMPPGAGTAGQGFPPGGFPPGGATEEDGKVIRGEVIREDGGPHGSHPPEKR